MTRDQILTHLLKGALTNHKIELERENSGSDYGMDNLARDYGEFEHEAARVMGENCTI